MRVLGVILAGGLARRMGGQDKALIMLGGQTLLERAIERLLPQVDDLVINANDDPTRFSKALSGKVEAGFPSESAANKKCGATNLSVIPDPDEERSGPLAGVLAGLDYARTVDATHIVTVAVDTPFFPSDLVVRLREAAEQGGVPLACAKTGERTHPVFGLWPVALADDLRKAMADGMRKVDRWTAKHGCAEAVFATDPFDPFFNVNTPDDLAEAERLLA